MSRRTHGLIEKEHWFHQSLTKIINGRLHYGASQVALVVKNLSANAGDVRDVGSIPGSERSPGEDKQPPPVYLPRESQGQRNLVGYSPTLGCKESDMTEVTLHAQVLLCPFYRWGNWVSQRLNYLLEVTQWAASRLVIETEASVVPFASQL